VTFGTNFGHFSGGHTELNLTVSFEDFDVPYGQLVVEHDPYKSQNPVFPPNLFGGKIDLDLRDLHEELTSEIPDRTVSAVGHFSTSLSGLAGVPGIWSCLGPWHPNRGSGMLGMR
jgi:hypothetical protein